MLHSLYTQISIVALVLCCGLAIWKGAPAERAGGILVLAAWTLTLVASISPAPKETPAVVYLISDAILAAGLLMLAVRYSNWWMGAAMLLQALSLSFNAAYFAADQSEMSLKTLTWYVFGKNLASLAMLLVLLAATIASMIKGRRSTAKAAALGMQPSVS